MIRVFFPKRRFIFLTAYADSLNYKMAMGSVTWFIIYILTLKVSFYIMYFFFYMYIYITPVNNLPLGARKPQGFTNIYNEQYN